MSRINVYLSEETKNRLAEYRHRVWGNHHSLSAIIQRAIKEFLDREDARAEEGKGSEKKG
ncbi:hypothetical protein ES706_06593 [subsurface metagenome]